MIEQKVSESNQPSEAIQVSRAAWRGHGRLGFVLKFDKSLTDEERRDLKQAMKVLYRVGSLWVKVARIRNGAAE